MTSKHLLWTRWVQQNKRYLWLYVINSILLLCFGPIRLLNYLSGYIVSDSGKREWALHAIGINFPFTFLFIGLGVLAGIYSFSYLHSQKKVDFYHNQPVSEGNRFLNISSCGLLCCYIPYSVIFLLNLLIVKSYGILNFDMFQQALASALIYMLAYFAAYVIAALMTIITGNILYSIALTGIAFVFEIIVRKTIVNLCAMFFYNYSVRSDAQTLQCKWSTVWTLLQKTEHILSTISSKELWEAVGGTCIRVAILSFVTAAIAYFAYKKRPMEYTGPSIAFHRLKPVIKVFITPALLLFLLDITYYEQGISGSLYGPENIKEFIRSFGRLLFGNLTMRNQENLKVFFISLSFLIIGVCICHVIFEFLWELDIRAIKKHLISSLVAGGFTILLFLGFRFDLFGYDTYVPNQKNVESVGIALDSYYIDSSLQRYRLKNVRLTCIKEACDAAKEICHNNTNYGLDLSDQQTVVDAEFAFHMKDGSTCYRTYDLIVDKGKNPLPNLLNNEEYNKATYPFLYDDKYTEKINLNKKNYLSWCDKSNHEVTLTPTGTEQIKKLQQAFMADYKDTSNNSPYTFQDEHKAIGLLTVKYPGNNKKVYDTEYLIFPEYTRTMECLHEMGVTTDTTTGFPLEEIESVTVCTSNDEKNKKTITDPAQIKELLSLVNHHWQPTDEGLDNNYEIYIQFKNHKNTDMSFFHFDDKVPEWLTKMFEK